jgi:hypothetical protein
MRKKYFNPSYLVLLIIVIAHLLLLSKITFFPNSELFIYPYLTNQGLLPYREILDQHFPGLMFLPVNFDNLGMTTPEAALHWHLVTVALIQILIFFVGKKIFKSEKLALLANGLFLVWQPFFEGYIQWLDVFLPLFLLPGYYFILKYLENKKDLLSLAVSGFILGLGVVFKQVLVPVAVLLGLYILWSKRNLKAVFLFSLAVLTPVAFMLCYLTQIGVLADFWYWTVVYNLTIFAEYGRKAIPSFSHLARFAFVYGIALAILVKYLKKLPVFLLGLFLLGSLSSVLARFDFVHLQPSLPFVVLLTAFGFGETLKQDSRRNIRYILSIGLGLYFLVVVYWAINFYRGHWGGRVFFFDAQTYQIAETVQKNTELGETIFIYGAVPHLYQMTGTIPAGRVFVFQFPWFMRVAEDRVLEGIKQDSPRLVLADRTVEVAGQPITDYAEKINAYLLENYVTFDKIGTTEFLIKKAEARD